MATTRRLFWVHPTAPLHPSSHCHFSGENTKYKFSWIEWNIENMTRWRSENECRQTIRNRLLESSVCTESHLFRPFSNGQSGATTRITQKLSYNSERRSDQVPTGDHNHFSFVIVNDFNSFDFPNLKTQQITRGRRPIWSLLTQTGTDEHPVWVWPPLRRRWTRWSKIQRPPFHPERRPSFPVWSTLCVLYLTSSSPNSLPRL